MQNLIESDVLNLCCQVSHAYFPVHTRRYVICYAIDYANNGDWHLRMRTTGGRTRGISQLGPPLCDSKMAGNELGQFLFTAFGKGMQEKIREHLRPDERGTETESAVAAGHSIPDGGSTEKDQKVKNLMLFSDVMGDFQKLMKQETGIDGEATGKMHFLGLNSRSLSVLVLR